MMSVMRKVKKGRHLECVLKTGIDSRPKIARKISDNVLKDWEEIFRRTKKQADNKQHSMALENAIWNELQNQLGKRAQVSHRKKRYLKPIIGIPFESDVLVQPAKSRQAPVSVISCKVTVAPESVKAAIGEAYVLGKLFKRHRTALRYYLVGAYRVKSRNIDEFAKVSYRYLHGIYTLAGPRFVDELVHELKRTYT
jgi:hypothetical protein